MKNNRNYGLYAIAAAIVVVGALALGASLGSLAWLALVAACPLMMFFMMRGMHGGHGDGDQHTDQSDPLRKHDNHQHPGSGRL
ncbi:DUF2933 domain-containing protein [Streptomyces sp. NBC_01481]|uniref:DUF2933 domain-containing protein n=1 Tax=Streptomyces sp. NBC_01481 TaxID=2975869 RepID=UPI002255E8E7|nr:DUF2933 domain-containing protein [Streptomyces sp. NBC_01481]MCX4584084.1 DUF2933 domain-containing protein [Streptomyces sp. NBC_01481]